MRLLDGKVLTESLMTVRRSDGNDPADVGVRSYYTDQVLPRSSGGISEDSAAPRMQLGYSITEFSAIGAGAGDAGAPKRLTVFARSCLSEID